jgi:hypothetical protein
MLIHIFNHLIICLIIILGIILINIFKINYSVGIIYYLRIYIIVISIVIVKFNV